MTTRYLTVATIIALLIAACWLARQIYRVTVAVRQARCNMMDAKRSDRHQTEIRMFLETQSKITRLDIQMGVMFGIILIMFLGVAGYLLVGLQTQP
jgi:hypothetical protein